jgi:hypothetical protein
MAQLDLTRTPSVSPKPREVRAKFQWHRYSLFILYTLTFAVTVVLIAMGTGYYGLPVSERPHHPLHDTLRPSGFVGHGIGIVGSAMMLLLLLYSMRKRARFMQNKGNIRYWLNYHIWLGVTGPTLVLFHTAFKFGGIVSISFWSMMAVAFSGVLGRYIYLQIPRSLSGHELSALDLEELDRDLMRQLEDIHGVDEDVLNSIQQLSAMQDMVASSGFSSVWSWMTHDLGSSSRLRHVHVLLHRAGMSRGDVHRVIKLARQKAKLRRRIEFLAQTQKLLHHWHIFHRPFAFVMLAIMFVHVIVAILFGQRWIWS